ncbi:methyltransferase domain-containing protein [Nocardia bovistercoris]|uniref:Uncharacterized protein n=1 Tax=Nocardia bovistercoris TaxID=2785916 RepID=A0A931IIB9_9NOCA|nr:hypothetical protein [Nocardia bovistercoris]MBH0780220.1 hypothetical protein [Nocardia bovistercoris]
MTSKSHHIATPRHPNTAVRSNAAGQPSTTQAGAGRPAPVDRRLELIGRKLAEHWEVARFPRLADTPVDDGHGEGVVDNPYWRFLRLMPRGGVDPAQQWSVEYGAAVRDLLVRTYSSSIPSPADLTWLERVLTGRGVVEIGAGSGYWAWQLRQAGIDVVAVDDGTANRSHLWTEVPFGNTADACDHGDRALALIRPPLDSAMAQTALDFYDGDLLIFAGDESTAAGRIFYDSLRTGWQEIGTAPHHPTYAGVACHLRAFRRHRRIPV